MSVTDDIVLAVVLALVFAVLIAAGIERLKYVAAKPAMAQADLALNSVKAMMARSNGYTLNYVLLDGTVLGITEGGQFSPSSFRPGNTVTYGSVEYEIVEVKDEWPSAIGTLVVKPTTPVEPADEQTTVFAAKYAAGLLSAYRDIANLGVALQDEIVVAEQSGSSPGTDLVQRAGSWANRCVTFANDPKGPLTADQRRAFRASPAAPASFTTLAAVVNANVAALRSVRNLFESSPA